MTFLDVPDYLSQAPVGMLPGLLHLLWFVVSFYVSMFVFLLMNTLLVAGVVWSLLITCRMLGIPWVDGTTSGFLNRK